MKFVSILCLPVNKELFYPKELLLNFIFCVRISLRHIAIDGELRGSVVEKG